MRSPAAALLSCALWVALASAQPDADLHITLERTACFGSCPAYTVTITAVRIGDRSKRVIDYVAGPQALRDLENEIDVVARTSLWVIGCDRDVVRRRARDGWSARSDEGKEYVF